MQFMVSLITDGSGMEGASPEEMREFSERMSAFMAELQDAGVLADHGAALGPAAEARTLRYGTEGKPVVTDGPFAESKEQMAGYMVLECADLEEAVVWAERMPVRGAAGVAVEVRPMRGNE